MFRLCTVPTVVVPFRSIREWYGTDCICPFADSKRKRVNLGAGSSSDKFWHENCGNLAWKVGVRKVDESIKPTISEKIATRKLIAKLPIPSQGPLSIKWKMYETAFISNVQSKKMVLVWHFKCLISFFSFMFGDWSMILIVWSCLFLQYQLCMLEVYVICCSNQCGNACIKSIISSNPIILFMQYQELYKLRHDFTKRNVMFKICCKPLWSRKRIVSSMLLALRYWKCCHSLWQNNQFDQLCDHEWLPNQRNIRPAQSWLRKVLETAWSCHSSLMLWWEFRLSCL